VSQVRLWAGVAVLLIAAGCSSDSPAPVEEGAGAMAHIHGIGVDPADGAIYAATHTGLFHINGQRALRVHDVSMSDGVMTVPSFRK
jgi:hypothetical protein